MGKENYDGTKSKTRQAKIEPSKNSTISPLKGFSKTWLFSLHRAKTERTPCRHVYKILNFLLESISVKFRLKQISHRQKEN